MQFRLKEYFLLTKGQNNSIIYILSQLSCNTRKEKILCIIQNLPQ